jgi:hypothetical protein
LTAPRHRWAGGIDGSLQDVVGEMPPYGLLYVGDQLVLAQSHHYALFLEQTLFDALGGESRAVRWQAAFESAHALLGPMCAEQYGGSHGSRGSPKEKLELASDLFAALGHGRLRFELSAEGGTARAEALHHGTSFLAKYGGRVQNRAALDAFAAGYCSAAASLAFPSDWGRLEAEEVTCVARGDSICSFLLTRRPESPRFGAILTRNLVETAKIQGEPDSGAVSRARRSGAAMLASLQADQRGLIAAYGANVAVHPVSYVDQMTFDTMHLIERRSPELSPVFEALAREAAQTGAFHLLGGMLSSPSFEAVHGPVGREQHQRLDQLLGLSRALGWGAFSAPEFVPGRALVLRAPVTHETAYYAVRHGATSGNRLVFQQGTALAIMQLLHRVDFGAVRPINPGTYAELFKSGTRFRVEETRSPLQGGSFCEVRVEAVADTW